MTKPKWAYVARGHYSTRDNGWTVHVLDNGAVYKTHPTRPAADVTGQKADRYIDSLPAKFHVRGKRRPVPEKEHKTSTKTADKPVTKQKAKKSKRKIGATAKKLASGIGAVIGTTRAFVTDIGEAEERSYEGRKAPSPKKKPEYVVDSRPTLARKKTTKKPPPTRPTLARKKTTKKPPLTRRTAPTHAADHPLQYLVAGSGGLPPSGRKQKKARHDQTLEEYMGF